LTNEANWLSVLINIDKILDMRKDIALFKKLHPEAIESISDEESSMDDYYEEESDDESDYM